MQIKSYLVEQNISSITNYISTLIYGENDGTKDDIKNIIKKENKDCEIINLYQDELLKNENILIEHINNISLFNNKKIIIINEANDKILKQLEPYLEDRLDVKIFIFSGVLDKKSKIRSLFEKQRILAAVACYQDNERTLVYYVNNKLKGLKGLTPEIVNIIISNSNLNRRIIKNEIQKIKHMFIEEKIELGKLEQLLNIKLNNDFNFVRDATLLGKKEHLNDLLSQIDLRREEFVIYINSLTNRLIKLLQIAQINEKTKNVEIALEALQMKVFWKDKPILIEQLSKWNTNNITQQLKDIGDTELQIKKNSTINNTTIIKNLLVCICRKAATL
jgi:DNA polymerase-3 subunit delta